MQNGRFFLIATKEFFPLFFGITYYPFGTELKKIAHRELKTA